ncbi:MAG TPA: glycerol kinase GlpK [bacterium]|nr:glycerol kinase GlpK [bacterium]
MSTVPAGVEGAGSGPYVAAIDQGTTGTRCIVFDTSGKPRANAYREHAQLTPEPGWVEHDAEEIWGATAAVVRDALAQAGLVGPRARLLAGVGVTNQRETTVLWDRRTGRPVYRAIVWQDTRTRTTCQALTGRGVEPLVRARTGLPIATYFSALKAAWVLDHVPGVRAHAERGDVCFGTIDSWVIWWLTGGPAGGVHVTDPTNASRTLLMDLRTQTWDDELLELFGLPRAMLPEIRCSSERYATTVPDGPFGAAVPVCGDLGDQQAALVGQTCYRPGDAKNTYGTGCFLLEHTGERPIPSRSGLLTTVAYALPNRVAFALEGSIAIAGAAVQWLRDNLGLIRTAEETEAIAGSVEDSGGAYFVPAFSGLFAPHWDMRARGVIAGLTRFVTRAHLVRATLEAICYQTREALEAMEHDVGIHLSALRVDGGASRNNLLMQLQADILGVPVIRPTVSETTALGAAYLAGLAAGVWDSLEGLRAHWKVDRRFDPTWPVDRREAGYAGWRRAVERARDWIPPDPAALAREGAPSPASAAPKGEDA